MVNPIESTQKVRAFQHYHPSFMALLLLQALLSLTCESCFPILDQALQLRLAVLWLLIPMRELDDHELTTRASYRHHP